MPGFPWSLKPKSKLLPRAFLGQIDKIVSTGDLRANEISPYWRAPNCKTGGHLTSMQPGLASPIRKDGRRGALEKGTSLLLLLLLVGLEVLVDDGDCQQDTWQKYPLHQIGELSERFQLQRGFSCRDGQIEGKNQDIQQDRTCARANGPHEIGDDGEGTDAHATECRGSGDVPVELLLERGGGVAVTLHESLIRCYTCRRHAGSLWSGPQ